MTRLPFDKLREARVSAQSWELLSSRCAVNLSQDEQKDFADAVRIYPTKERVAEYNNRHMVDLNSLALYVAASNEGPGEATAESKDAGNLSKGFSCLCWLSSPQSLDICWLGEWCAGHRL